MADLESIQWKRAQQTSLWRRTLGSDDEDVKPLRESFLDARENAAVLLDKIRPDFPNLTIHDITHVDSLWTVADAIIGEKYPINPLEGYVLGIAFLIHDVALSYDAVGGKEKLRKEDVWKDAFAEGPGKLNEDDFLKECDFTAIRAIHAREAKDIMNKTFSSDDMPSFHIVKKASYRHSLGEIIGKIAASHHWSIDEIETKLDIQITPSSEIPGFWDINAQKLACILRCADAGHIDDGRAPYYIFRSLNVNGVSLEHWKYQSNLGMVQPYRKDNSKLLITSTSSFKKEDFAAWNVAYEAVKWFDEEIKKSNNLLKTIDEKLVFPRTGVMGASSKEDLAEYIKTEGWLPCNFGVHTSNVKYLIETLGGSKLYGEDNLLVVALRELIQNARDAIHARQKLEDSFDNGKITIRFKEEGAERFIEVEDNGIGMSMDCIKHNLLDFGSSYWKSSLSRYENPGLQGKGFKSVGQFGIGFYSVFMVAKSVEVITKRFGKAADDAKKVEFPAGLTLSPIISKCELNANTSTIVRFFLKNNIKLKFKCSGLFDVTFKEFLPSLVVGLDVDVYLKDNNELSLIHRNIASPFFSLKEWLNSVYEYRHSVHLANEMEPILVGNQIRGYICILSSSYYYDGTSFLTIGGLLANLHRNVFHGYNGYLDFNNYNLSRDSVYFDEPLKKVLHKWIVEKYIHEHEKIQHSYNLANNFFLFMDFIELSYDDIKRLINFNEERIYCFDFSNYISKKTDIEIIQIIHRRLYSGIMSNPGQIRFGIDEGVTVNIDEDKEDEFYIDYDYNKEELLERISIINNMPENSFCDLILKYLLFDILDPFPYGSTRTLEIWLNIMLDRLSQQMLDWGLVDMNHYITLQEQFNKDSNPNPICNYLEQFLVDSEKRRMSSNELIW